MIVTCEQYQDKVYILGADGKIWRFKIGYDGQPEIEEMMEHLSRERINMLMRPKLALFDRDNS